MADKHWFTIDASHFRRPVSEKFGAATVFTSTSPYAVPDAVAAYTDKKSGHCFFEAKYIGPEEPLEAFFWENSKILRGKNSKRLFMVTVPDPGVTQKSEIFDAIQKVLTNVAASHKWPIDNYAIVSAVIDENKNRLPIEDLAENAASK